MGDYLLTVDPVKMLENKLEQMLQPVRPNPVFINHLQQRLMSSSPTVLEKRPKIRAYFIVVAGLVCGVFIFWIIRRLRSNRE